VKSNTRKTNQKSKTKI